MKAVVFTLGCKVNSCESASIVTGLKELGFEVSDKLSCADLYVVNTCAVTKEAEKKSRQAIARVRSFNENAKIIVCGCASEHNPESFISKKGVYLVTGALNKDKIISLINSEGVVIDTSCEYYEKYLPAKDFKTRSYVKVEDGCNNFCSYCLIPYLRGRCRSRSIESIKCELDYLDAKEVVITGINLTAYNYEGKDLADMLAELKDYGCRIRLGSLEENVITEKLLKSLASLKDFAPHFHLSLQSGSDKVLKSMNRRYDRQKFIDGVKKVREYFPDAAITTDIIVGFPTETEEDFCDTVALCEKVDFADIHCFVFSPREGTVAYKMKQLGPSVCEDRLNRLLAVKKQAKERFAEKFVGKTLSMLPEEFKSGYTVGYSQNYIRCYVDGKLGDDFTCVEVIKPFRDGALCKVVEKF